MGGVVTIAVAYAATVVAGSAPAWAPWFLAVGGSAASVALFVIGAATRGVHSRAVGVLLAALLVVLVASFGAALAPRTTAGPGEPLLFGLPLRLAIVFYGVVFLPLLVLPLAHARSFPAADADSPPASPASGAPRDVPGPE